MTTLVLVDTSIWIDYLRRGVGELASLLENNQVLVHPFVIGELACGNLGNREEILRDLMNLPVIVKATDEEVRHLIASSQLMARGVGYLDMHLLASLKLDGRARLWTRDKRLATLSSEMSRLH